MVEPGPEREGGEPPLVAAARYSGLGLQVAGSVGLFMAAGWWVDGKLGTTPLVTIVGALGGGAAGFYSVYRQVTGDRTSKPREP